MSQEKCPRGALAPKELPPSNKASLQEIDVVFLRLLLIHPI